MKIIVTTPQGIFQTGETKATQSEIDEFGELLETVSSGKASYFKLRCENGTTHYFGKNTIINSTFTISL